MKKRCKTCAEIKNVGRFYADSRMADGYTNDCKACKRKAVTENREAKAEKYLAYDRERSRLPHRVAYREAYAKTDAGKRARLKANRVYRRFKALEARA